jgi:hypothetical protein
MKKTFFLILLLFFSPVQSSNNNTMGPVGGGIIGAVVGGVLAGAFGYWQGNKNNLNSQLDPLHKLKHTYQQAEKALKPKIEAVEKSNEKELDELTEGDIDSFVQADYDLNQQESTLQTQMGCWAPDIKNVHENDAKLLIENAQLLRLKIQQTLPIVRQEVAFNALQRKNHEFTQKYQAFLKKDFYTKDLIQEARKTVKAQKEPYALILFGEALESWKTDVRRATEKAAKFVSAKHRKKYRLDEGLAIQTKITSILDVLKNLPEYRQEQRDMKTDEHQAEMRVIEYKKLEEIRRNGEAAKAEARREGKEQGYRTGNVDGFNQALSQLAQELKIHGHSHTIQSIRNAVQQQKLAAEQIASEKIRNESLNRIGAILNYIDAPINGRSTDVLLAEVIRQLRETNAQLTPTPPAPNFN